MRPFRTNKMRGFRVIQIINPFTSCESQEPVPVCSFWISLYVFFPETTRARCFYKKDLSAPRYYFIDVSFDRIKNGIQLLCTQWNKGSIQTIRPDSFNRIMLIGICNKLWSHDVLS